MSTLQQKILNVKKMKETVEKQGTTLQDVKCLELFLNRDGETSSLTGPKPTWTRYNYRNKIRQFYAIYDQFVTAM